MANWLIKSVDSDRRFISNFLGLFPCKTQPHVIQPWPCLRNRHMQICYLPHAPAALPRILIFCFSRPEWPCASLWAWHYGCTQDNATNSKTCTPPLMGELPLSNADTVWILRNGILFCSLLLQHKCSGQKLMLFSQRPQWEGFKNLGQGSSTSQ